MDTYPWWRVSMIQCVRFSKLLNILKLGIVVSVVVELATYRTWVFCTHVLLSYLWLSDVGVVGMSRLLNNIFFSC